jgi:hypothetical protein
VWLIKPRRIDGIERDRAGVGYAEVGPEKETPVGLTDVGFEHRGVVGRQRDRESCGVHVLDRVQAYGVALQRRRFGAAGKRNAVLARGRTGSRQ